MTRPPVQSSSTKVWEPDSDQQLESDRACLLSPILFNIFLERITTDTVEGHEGNVGVGDRTITNLRFADNIGGLAAQEEWLAKLVQHLNKASTVYGMRISVEKIKLMTNNTSGIIKEIKVNGQNLGTVTSLKHPGSVVSGESSKPKILSRKALTTEALTRLKPVWNDRSISLSSRLMCSLVTSILLYACESWTPTAQLQRRMRAMEMRCYFDGSYKCRLARRNVWIPGATPMLDSKNRDKNTLDVG